MASNFPVRVVLQKRDAQLYLLLPCKWTIDVAQATDFHNTGRALAAALNFRGLQVDVLMVFNDRRYDIRLPVQGK